MVYTFGNYLNTIWRSPIALRTVHKLVADILIDSRSHWFLIFKSDDHYIGDSNIIGRGSLVISRETPEISLSSRDYGRG